MVEAHAEGEIGRCITGGVFTLPRATMLGKMSYLNTVDDRLRRFCTLEPRGFAQMSTNLLLAPSAQEADAGMIVMQADRAHAFSGSNGICAVTVLLETGTVAMREPESVVRLDAPAGLVVARARCRDGKCETVTLGMPPGFVEALDVGVDVPGLGKIVADVAFGVSTTGSSIRDRSDSRSSQNPPGRWSMPEAASIARWPAPFRCVIPNCRTSTGSHT